MHVGILNLYRVYLRISPCVFSVCLPACLCMSVYRSMYLTNYQPINPSSLLYIHPSIQPAIHACKDVCMLMHVCIVFVFAYDQCACVLLWSHRKSSAKLFCAGASFSHSQLVETLASGMDMAFRSRKKIGQVSTTPRRSAFFSRSSTSSMFESRLDLLWERPHLPPDSRRQPMHLL